MFRKKKISFIFKKLPVKDQKQMPSFHGFSSSLMRQSIPDVNSPRADPRAIFSEGKISPAGQKIAAKPRPSGQKIMWEKALKRHPGANQELKLW